MKKILMFMGFMMASASVNAANASSGSERNRATVKQIEMHIVDEGTNYKDVVTMDFCAGNYRGVSGILFGESAIEMQRRAVCAHGVDSCQMFDDMWEGRLTPDQPRKPTMLLIFDVEELDKSKVNIRKVPAKKQRRSIVNNAINDGYELDIVVFPDGTAIATSCGGAVHPAKTENP